MMAIPICCITPVLTIRALEKYVDRQSMSYWHIPIQAGVRSQEIRRFWAFTDGTFCDETTFRFGGSVVDRCPRREPAGGATVLFVEREPHLWVQYDCFDQLHGLERRITGIPRLSRKRPCEIL